METENRTDVLIPEGAIPSQINGSVTATVTPPRPALATEAGHWYMRDGAPFYTIGDRPVTLRDARKVGAVPSVTTITGIVASPALQKYFERHIFRASMSYLIENGL